MTLDQIEELIRKYLAMGVTVVIILTGVPTTGGSAASNSSSSPSVMTIAPRAPTSSGPTTATAPPGSSDTTGASGVDPGAGGPSAADPSGDSPTGSDTTSNDTNGTSSTDTNGSEPGGTDPTGSANANAAATGSAAAELGWGTPSRADDFTSGIGQWRAYDGAGHNGKGTRSPGAATVEDGVLTITGSPDGTTEGLAWNPGQKYGRWEARVRTPAGDPSYHAVMLLWPDAENWPAGGEVDFMEISDPSRQTTDMFLHYGKDNSQKSGKVQIDATQWHDWAVDWTPKGITAYVDGREWWKTTDTSILPPGPMHMTIQLDWFPGGGSVKQSSMSVDWVRQYPAAGG